MNDQARSLLDRYIYAIRRLLPGAQRDDIAAELLEALESQVDGEESRAGRSLHGEEIAAILKRFGQPREVAARYGSPQYLIGPDVFPSYIVAVKIATVVMVPVAVFLVLLSIVTAEDHLFERLLDTLWTVLSIGLVNLSIVTLMFVYFGRASSGNLNDADWDLDDLPEVPADPNTPLPKSESIGSLVGLVLMLCWWLGLNAALQRWFGWEAFPIVWTPVWADLHSRRSFNPRCRHSARTYGPHTTSLDQNVSGFRRNSGCPCAACVVSAPGRGQLCRCCRRHRTKSDWHLRFHV